MPPAVLCACAVGKGVAVLMKEPKDMRKACAFEVEVTDYDKREIHQMRAAKFHGPSGLPLVLRIQNLASVVHESDVVKALHQEFPCNKFHVYQMLAQKGGARMNNFFVVFSEAPAHVVKSLYFRELPKHKGKVRPATLVVDDVCCSCETLTPHSEDSPCKYWVYLWTSVEGRYFCGKGLAEQWLAEKQSAEEKTVRPLHFKRAEEHATAHRPFNSSIPQANSAEDHTWFDAPGPSKSVPWSSGTIEADKAKGHERFITSLYSGVPRAESAISHHERRDAGLFSFGRFDSSKNNDQRAAPVFHPLRDVD
ncbi:hypothetical protein LTR84_010904 [Exophiala bonariae]|uniref:RRM domain-containing protein n=1 Tax=Exophiala bonariae TaxID=1690606 RepID=A0AAV9NHQ4_9EURO|nr:hypothetical protein LTR84_010904 [Exophiala bonariae]